MAVELLGLSPVSWVLVLLVLLLAYWYNDRKQAVAGLPPGPPALPILGSLPFCKSTDILVTLRHFQKKYGDLFTMDLGTNRVVVLNTYPLIKEALVKQGTAFMGRPMEGVGMYFRANTGILMTNGDKWTEQRRYTLHTLREFGLGKNLMERFIMEELESLLTKLEKYCGKPHNPKHDMQLASANIITSFAFGRRMEHDNPSFVKLVETAIYILGAAGSAGLLAAFPFLRHIPFFDITFYRGMEEGTMTVMESIHQWIEERKEELKTHSEGDRSDLISTYLLEIKKRQKENDKDTYFTEEQLKWIVFDLYAGGMETTSMTMVWSILYLVLYPEVQAKIHKELDDVVGLSRRPSLRDKTQLSYCEAVMSEVMRVVDLGPLVPKCLLEDANIGGYHLRAGTSIVVNLNSCHHDPELFPDPSKFDPTRFLDENGKYKKNDAFMPFSIGRRACVGESLARMENFLFFTSMFQNFSFHIPEGHPKPSTQGKLGLANIAQPFDVIMTKRH